MQALSALLRPTGMVAPRRMERRVALRPQAVFRWALRSVSSHLSRSSTRLCRCLEPQAALQPCPSDSTRSPRMIAGSSRAQMWARTRWAAPRPTARACGSSTPWQTCPRPSPPALRMSAVSAVGRACVAACAHQQWQSTMASGLSLGGRDAHRCLAARSCVHGGAGCDRRTDTTSHT
jgi:hypothetical protein